MERRLLPARVMRPLYVALSCIASMLFAPSLASAAERASSSTPPPPEHRYDGYLSFSPFHLSRPIVELTAEARLHDQIGAAIIGGLGSVGETGNRATYWDVGGQLLWYAWGSFDTGLHLGVEAAYVGLAGRREKPNLLTGSVNSVSVGPLVGFKWAASCGFTTSAQGGIGYVAAKSQLAPIVNVNLGWSF